MGSIYPLVATVILRVTILGKKTNMLPIWFIYIAALLRISGGLAYLTATLRGKAKPNPASWLLWGIMPMITFFAGLSAGVGIEMVITLASGLSPLLVFCATIYKNPRSLKLRGFNLVCVVIAIIGIVLWPTTENPEVAIGMLLLADLFSSLPTILKARKKPSTEFSPTYLMSAASMIIALLTITEWRFAAVAYPIYALVANLLIFSLARYRVKPKRQRKR